MPWLINGRSVTKGRGNVCFELVRTVRDDGLEFLLEINSKSRSSLESIQLQILAKEHLTFSTQKEAVMHFADWRNQ